MDFRAEKIESAVEKLDGFVCGLSSHAGPTTRPALQRWRADAAALLFHLRRDPASPPPVLVVLGGTGTGKSTVVNRLLGQTVSATSYRRTFTSGAVAAAIPKNLPAQWLNVEHEMADPAASPARGRAGALVVVPLETDLLQHITLVDTPDLDGDQPSHHAEADRAFRWADALLLLVTPEKYQMTELLPYYRLAARYRLAAFFVMNKCEQQPVADDYEKLLRSQDPQFREAEVFVVPRDDAAYEPPPRQNLAALRGAIGVIRLPEPQSKAEGLRHRSEDLLGRLADQIVAPLRDDRREIDRLVGLLRGMEAPVAGVDVNPLTQQLQRRMQQRSVLYLMGPQRILDRVRQAPGLLVRLPRVAWDYVMRGEVSAGALSPQSGAGSEQAPDFREVLKDQFAVVQSRLDDALRASPMLRRWSVENAPPPYQPTLIDSSEAARIADEELAELRSWLEQRWNATPRDTRILESFLKHLPGGKQITRWTEAAPYLLVVVVAAATHHLFGGVDLVVLGGWSVATWLSERLSNEVAARTRQTNQRITDRFTRLAHDQIERICRWLNDQAPTAKALEQLEGAMEQTRELIHA